MSCISLHYNSTPPPLLFRSPINTLSPRLMQKRRKLSLSETTWVPLQSPSPCLRKVLQKSQTCTYSGVWEGRARLAASELGPSNAEFPGGGGGLEGNTSVQPQSPQTPSLLAGSYANSKLPEINRCPLNRPGCGIVATKVKKATGWGWGERCDKITRREESSSYRYS